MKNQIKLGDNVHYFRGGVGGDVGEVEVDWEECLLTALKSLCLISLIRSNLCMFVYYTTESRFDKAK